MSPKKQTRRRPAIGAASFVVFRICLPPPGAAGRYYRSDSFPEGSPLLPAPAARSDSENRTRNRRDARQPNPLKEREVEEAAMPGQPEALTRS